MTTKEKVTIVLPSELIDAVREMAPPRGQSDFIAKAITCYISGEKRKALRERLIAGYQANAAADLAITHEWQILDEETWFNHVPAYEGEEPAHDAADTAW